MVEFLCVRCSDCGVAQCIQRPKSRKYSCRLCGVNQSVKHLFAVATRASDIRAVVMSLNASRAEAEVKEGQEARRIFEEEQQRRSDGGGGESSDEGSEGSHGSSGVEDAAAAAAQHHQQAPSMPPIDWSVFQEREEDVSPPRSIAAAARSSGPSLSLLNSQHLGGSASTTAAFPSRSHKRARSESSSAQSPRRPRMHEQATASPFTSSLTAHMYASSSSSAASAAASSAGAVATPVAAGSDGGGGSSSSRWACFQDDEDAQAHAAASAHEQKHQVQPQARGTSFSSSWGQQHQRQAPSKTPTLSASPFASPSRAAPSQWNPWQQQQQQEQKQRLSQSLTAFTARQPSGPSAASLSSFSATVAPRPLQPSAQANKQPSAAVPSPSTGAIPSAPADPHSSLPFRKNEYAQGDSRPSLPARTLSGHWSAFAGAPTEEWEKEAKSGPPAGKALSLNPRGNVPSASPAPSPATAAPPTHASSGAGGKWSAFADD